MPPPLERQLVSLTAELLCKRYEAAQTYFSRLEGLYVFLDASSRWSGFGRGYAPNKIEAAIVSSSATMAS